MLEISKKEKEIRETLSPIVANDKIMTMIASRKLNIDKECRLKDTHDIEPLDRMQVHDWLVNQSNSNPWIEKGFKSAKSFRP